MNKISLETSHSESINKIAVAFEILFQISCYTFIMKTERHPNSVGPGKGTERCTG